MSRPAWLEPLQALVTNRLPAEPFPQFAGLIGDHPSTYARSPRIWNPALRALGVDACYLPLDVPPGRLEAVLRLARESEACLGFNVTVPHKHRVMRLLDVMDAAAAAIGAVNTIVRLPDGRLRGANTDGQGLVAALGRDHGHGPLIGRIDGARVLLIGAGGAAAAAAVTLAARLGGGELVLMNRHRERAAALAARVAALGGRARAARQEEIEAALPSVDLVVNGSLVGQAGINKDPHGWTCLEPYSALAPAHPAVLPPMPEEEFFADWHARSADDIARNHARSRGLMARLPRHAAVYDMIYAPPETVMLRHARETGLRAENGRWMNILQAVEACLEHICRAALDARGIVPARARPDIERVMAAAWDDQ